MTHDPLDQEDADAGRDDSVLEGDMVSIQSNLAAEDDELEGLIASPDDDDDDFPVEDGDPSPETSADDHVETKPSLKTINASPLVSDLTNSPHFKASFESEVASRNQIIYAATKIVIERHLSGQSKLTPDNLERVTLAVTNEMIHEANAKESRETKMSYLKSLTHAQIATLLVELDGVSLIATSTSNDDREYDLVGQYMTSGDRKGTYSTSEDDLRRLARQYNFNMTIQEYKEIIASLRDSAPRRFVNENPDLIAVNNGIFDYKKKRLTAFDPEIVFLSKSRVNYNPSATCPTIYNEEDGTEWDVETWIKDLSNDEGIPELIWQICGAVLRPNVKWDKAAFFYADSGSNGKGTVLTLLRNLVGPGSHCSLPIADMGKDFMLEQLVGKQAILVDENDVGMYLEKAANLKAIITQDVLSINRKYKSAITYRFQGFMVQCLNDEPKIRDKSDSLYRRALFIPMNKRFTGIERKYIKSDYLARPEVLEYVLKRVLEMDYYTLSEPEASKAVLREYKTSNDPVREFFENYEKEFVWDAVPFTFLYDAYRSWFAYNVPSGSAVGSRTFVKDIRKIVESSAIWECREDERFYPRGLMDAPEPIIAELNLKDWMNPNYRGNATEEVSKPKLKDRYRGIFRTVYGQTQTEEPLV